MLYIEYFKWILMREHNKMKSETFSQSDPKRKILYFLKVMKQAGLKDLSKVMKISRMADTQAFE